MASQPSPDQVTLSEQLQLLHELRDCELDMSYQAAWVHTNKDIRHRDTSTDIRILDVIALALTTGEPEEVVAATFDRGDHLSLVLAKNRPPTREDEDATARLFATITDPATRDAFDVFPFLLSRCRTNMEKRISNLHESVSAFLPDLHSALPLYKPLSVKKELPHSAIYRRRRYKGEEPEFSTMISKLVLYLSELSASPLDPDDVDKSTMRYSVLDNLAKTLLHSPFLNFLCEDRHPWNSACKERAGRLKRRLEKVCQYFGGVTQLVKMAKKWFPDGRIPYRWVRDTFVGSGEGQVSLCDDYKKVVHSACDAETPLSAKDLQGLALSFPEVLSNWEHRRPINTCIHAELRIILHFSGPLSSSSSHTHLRRPPDDSDQHAIGCSKRSCFCCTLWIDAYNEQFGTGWITSGFHRKPCTTWALPGDAATHGTGVDEAVVRGVQTRLANALSWLYPESRRMYDDLDSSDDEISGSEQSFEEYDKLILT